QRRAAGGIVRVTAIGGGDEVVPKAQRRSAVRRLAVGQGHGGQGCGTVQVSNLAGGDGASVGRGERGRNGDRLAQGSRVLCGDVRQGHVRQAAQSEQTAAVDGVDSVVRPD